VLGFVTAGPSIPRSLWGHVVLTDMSAGLRLFQPWSRALQLGLALCLSTSIPAMAEGRSAFAEVEAEALSKLSRQQRHRYFDDLRALQRRRFDQRQADLTRLEGCLDRKPKAKSSDCFERQHRQGHARWRRELQALRQRYNLPVPPSHHHRPS